MYAKLDEQSIMTVARKELFDFFDTNSPQKSYILSTCGGRVITSSRRSSGFIVSSLGGNMILNLPSIIGCDNVMPFQTIVKKFQQLKLLAITHTFQIFHILVYLLSPALTF